MRIAFLLPCLMLSTVASALDATCEIYLGAAEKSARQPARHTITQPGDGSTLEAIALDGKFYSGSDGKWRLFKTNLLAAELDLIASIRSGRFPMTGCRNLGSESFEGKSTTVIAYTLKVPGADAGESRAYVGRDGLVHGQISGDVKVLYRYTGVKAPAL